MAGQKIIEFISGGGICNANQPVNLPWKLNFDLVNRSTSGATFTISTLFHHYIERRKGKNKRQVYKINLLLKIFYFQLQLSLYFLSLYLYIFSVAKIFIYLYFFIRCSFIIQRNNSHPVEFKRSFKLKSCRKSKVLIKKNTA